MQLYLSEENFTLKQEDKTYAISHFLTHFSIFLLVKIDVNLIKLY